MPGIRTLSALLAFTATTIAGPLTARAQSSNVVVYWGQGSNRPLTTVCAESSVDTVIIGFVNVFPDQDPNNTPGSNFANSCSPGAYYKTSSGATTSFLVGCDDIAQGIQTCHQNNKKVLISLGGAYPTNQFITNTTTANYFADYLWGAFGPQTTAWTNAGNPRPFGSQVVDGFDFDIESDYGSGVVPKDQAGNPVPNYKFQGYAQMITKLRSNAAAANTPILISGAPQCVVPDAHLNYAIANSYFDFLFVQFYNTNGCSARDGVNTINGNTAGGDISFNQWATNSNNGVPSNNPNVPIYIGLPGATSAANSGFYITPDEAYSLVKKFYGNARFGGISIWADTQAANNVICGKTYTAWMRQILTTLAAGGTWTSAAVCPSSSSSSVSSTTSIVPSSKAPSVSPTSSSTSSTSTSSSTSSKPTSTTSSTSSSSTSTSSSVPVKSPSASSVTSTTSSTSSKPSSTSTSTTNSKPVVLSSSASSTKSSSTTSSTSSSTKTSSTSSFNRGGGKAVDPTASFTLDPSGSDPTASVPTWATSPGWFFANSSMPVTTPAPSSSWAPVTGTVTTTVITTAYVDICPTGFTTITTTYTTTVCPESTSKAAVPEGWKTTVTICTVCGPKETTVTLTKPVTVTKTENKTWTSSIPGEWKEGSWTSKPETKKTESTKPVSSATWAKSSTESDVIVTETQKVIKTSTSSDAWAKSTETAYKKVETSVKSSTWAAGPTASAGWTKTTSPGMPVFTGAAAGKMVGGIGAGAAAFAAAVLAL